MSKAAASYDHVEFERESERLASLVWDAMGISSGDRVLFCGYGPDVAIVRRAAAEGAKITVIESRDELMKRYEDLEVTVLRGSTSAIPARDNSFEVAVANSYLHEIDPLFHANVIQELGRVAARVVVVEPMPPSDAIGKRIATLYSRAKRELGQFEYYQAPSYWRKLLSMSKSQIAEAVFAFAKTPPHEYLVDTLKLLLDTMKVEEAPQYYIDQLHELAAKPGAQLLPQGRLVLIGVAEKGGALPAKSMAALLSVGHGGPAAPAPAPDPPAPTPAASQEAVPPVVQPVSKAAPEPEMGESFAPQPEPAEASFGLPEDEAQPFGAPGIDQPPLGWHWEPPEESGPI
ncbi:hypothetical protein EPN42_02050 [bacterium]|nr:MAG: hypothetical protein EPN42_02050 [bacterium]